MRYPDLITTEEHDTDQDTFEKVTEQEIILLWHSFKSNGLSGDQAWHAILTGIALDMAFARTRSSKQIEQ